MTAQKIALMPQHNEGRPTSNCDGEALAQKASSAASQDPKRVKCSAGVTDVARHTGVSVVKSKETTPWPPGSW